MIDKTLSPQDIDAEKALLGTILINSDVFLDITDIVTSDSFYIPKHKTIFDAIIDLSKEGDSIDVVTLGRRLSEKKQLIGIGGRKYLAELTNSSTSTAYARNYARIVEQTFTRRKLIQAGETITDYGYDEGLKTEEVMDKAEKSLFDVTHRLMSDTYRGIEETIEPVFEQILKVSEEGKRSRGIPTGFAALDNLLAGFHNSDLVILAARPGVGKTTFALDVARRTSIKNDIPVGIFSLEMNKDQLIERMLSSEALVDAWRVRTGKLKGGDSNILDSLRNAVDRLRKAPIFIDDRPSMSILNIRSTARRMKRAHGIKMIIVDYLQLVTAYDTKRSDSMVQQVTEISRTLKQIARELEIPVIAISQLSRDIEKRSGKPRLSDLRDSGSIEQDADVVMFLHQETRYEDGDTGEVNLLVEKHRNGPTGKIKLHFDKKHTTFLESSKEEYNDMSFENMIENEK